MAKRSTTDEQPKGAGGTGTSSAILRAPAEVQYARELDALIGADKHEKPPGWRLSPRAVLTYITGGSVGDTKITPKYIGHQRLVEIAISTLVTDRALLLIGEPGTAKSWLSEHLAAAINGDSSKVVQGTAGTTEEQVRYAVESRMARYTPAGKTSAPVRILDALGDADLVATYRGADAFVLPTRGEGFGRHPAILEHVRIPR